MIAIVIVENASELERAQIELRDAVPLIDPGCLRRLIRAAGADQEPQGEIENEAKLPVFLVKGRDRVAHGKTLELELGRRRRRGLSSVEHGDLLDATRAGVFAGEPSSGTGEIRFGRLLLQPAAHRVFVDGTEIELTWLEMRLLMTFYERRDRVLSREELLRDVWDVRGDVTTRTVDTHVKRLRSKLGAAQRYIETVRKAGYRFVSGPDAPSIACSSSLLHGVGLTHACRQRPSQRAKRAETGDVVARESAGSRARSSAREMGDRFGSVRALRCLGLERHAE